MFMVTSIHPSGLTLARGERDGLLSLCQIATSTLIWYKPAHQGKVTVLAWNTDGTQLASGGRDGQVHVWHASTGKRLASFRHGRAVQQLRWSWDGVHLASVSGNRLRLWEPRYGPEEDW